MAIGKTSGFRNTSTLWRVYLPVDIDRSLYIKSCYNTSTVSLINDNSEIYSGVPVGKTCIQYIEFPEDSDQLGSHVMCITEPRSNKPFVIEVFNSSDEYDFVEENQHFIQQKTSSGSANISVDGLNGLVSISSNSNVSDSGVTVSSHSESGDSSISLESDIVSVKSSTEFSVESENKISLKVSDNQEDELFGEISYELGSGLTYVDEFDNSITIDDNGLKAISKKIMLGEGSEPILLGQKTVDLVGDLITEIASSMVITSTGNQPLINSQKILAFKSKLDELKSNLSFTD